MPEIPAPETNTAPDHLERFIGSWKLISFEVTLASGTVLKPFGEHPNGLILYQNDGHMSAQLMLPNPAAFASPDPLQATEDETDVAWRNYVGYWGKFTVHPEQGLVVHHVEGCWFPNWIGDKQVRSFHFEESKLILDARSPAWDARLVWQRSN